MDNLLVLAQRGGGGGGAFGALIWFAIIGVMVASMWKVFEKAGQPGWGAIVPVFNIYVMCKIANRPPWWLVLFFIPFVNIIAFAMLSVDIAKAFGKSPAFGVGLFLLGFVFYPVLAFSSAEYMKPSSPNYGGSFDDRSMAA